MTAPHDIAAHRRRTRIVATLGPATDPPEVLEAVLRGGGEATADVSGVDPREAAVAVAQAFAAAAR